MKTNFQISLFLMLAFSLLASCKSQQYTAENLPEQQLVFGEGGGFTGAVTQYILLENGQIFKHYSMEASTVELGSVKKRTAKEMMKKVQAMQLDTMDVKQPGNMYYFLSYKTGEDEHRVTWGAASYQVDSQIESFYKELMQMSKNVKAPKK